MTTRLDGAGGLRQMMNDASAATGLPLSGLTVLSATTDPFRLDTPKNHMVGAWLACTLADLAVALPIHLRGMHYALIGHPKPEGSPYANTDDDWVWLGSALKAARWLGYVSFDEVIDNRNAAPLIRFFEPNEPFPYVSSGVDVTIDDDVHPWVGLADFTSRQRYRLALVGEKASLKSVLQPIADTHDADLLLPTGNLSDTLVHQLAQAAATDGRTLQVFYFADCDPSGWHMPIEVSRKLQAFRALHFPDLDFEVHRVGLTPDQVLTLGLPSTPLKVTERRADGWRAAMGVDQTEIDALATLQPAVLRDLATEALAPYFDEGLDQRTRQIQRTWIDAAQQVVDDAAGTPEMQRIQESAREQLAGLREQIDALNDALRVDPGDLELPELPDLPVAENAAVQPKGLVDSRDDFATQVRGLIADRNYQPGGA